MTEAAQGELRSARLVLRPLTRRLAEDVVAGHHRPDWATGFPQAGDRTVAQVWLAGPSAHGDPGTFTDPEWGAYAVWTILGVCIGTAGFFGAPEHGEVEVGYGIAPSHRGRGLATEAVGVLVDLARERGVARVVARVDADNDASLRVLGRLGFRRMREGAEEIVLALALPGSSARGAD